MRSENPHPDDSVNNGVNELREHHAVIEQSQEISNHYEGFHLFTPSNKTQPAAKLTVGSSCVDFCEHAQLTGAVAHIGDDIDTSTKDRWSNLPPDLISISSCASLDDSVSSISSSDCSVPVEDRTHHQPSPRTIFKDYWDTNREEKPFSYVKPSIIDRPQGAAGNSLKRVPSAQTTLPIQERIFCRGNNSSKSSAREERARRSIFGNLRNTHLYSSVPVLRVTAAMPQGVRKASSTSTLLIRNGQLRPCLHSVQHYSEQNYKRNSNEEKEPFASSRKRSSGSVSFCPRVDVYEFETAQEIFSKDVWQKRFIY